MPPVRTPIDALWHCLWPSFNQVRPTTFHPYPKPAKELFRNYAPACVLKEGRHRKPQRTHAHRDVRKQTFSSVPDDPHLLRSGDRLHDLTTVAAYEELRHAGLTGNYLRVQALVKILVRDRGEKLSPRLYLALLLANTNPQHGSPANVKTLLQEMRDEGLTPDSSVLHAALKVG